MIDYMATHFASATDETLGRWSESDMREYLIKKGLLKSDRQAKKDEMIKMIKKSGNSLANDVQEYIFWSDKRLRGYLRSQGVSTPDMPTTREELLSKTKEKWEATSKRVDSVLSSLRQSIFSGAHAVEDKLLAVLAAAGGSAAHGVEYAAQAAGSAASSLSSAATTAQASATSASAKHAEL